MAEKPPNYKMITLPNCCWNCKYLGVGQTIEIHYCQLHGKQDWHPSGGGFDVTYSFLSSCDDHERNKDE